jgi:TonB family protein
VKWRFINRNRVIFRGERRGKESIHEGSAVSRCLTVKYFITVVFCCFAAVWPNNVRAEDRKNLEGDLRRAFQNKILSLRNPYFGSRLQFDSSGNLVGKADAGPWSTCGLLQVEKVALGPDHLEIDGRRVVLALRSGATDKPHPSIPQAAQITTLVTEDRVRIFVEMSALDVPQVNQILSHVFQGGQRPERVNAYWKPNTTDVNAFRRNTPNAIIAELEGNRPVYLVNPGVVAAPKPTHTPDPTYTETARRNKLQGTAILSVAVNEKGFPEVLQIAQSLDEGLDTQALAAVAGWRFQPAMKDGQPVAVLINVQVTFRLY